jgi:stage V sporulation protein B
MKINIADALISVVLVWLLIPRYGIDGYVFAVYFSEFFNTVCSITHLLSIRKTAVRLIKWIYKPLICIVFSTSAAYFLWRIPALSIESGVFSLILHCASVVLLYVLLLRLLQGIDREDAEWIKEILTPPPRGERKRLFGKL